MTLFDYNSTELLVKNKSVHPPIIFKKTVMHSHNNLEIILLQLDHKFKNSFFSGLCCLFLFHFPFLVIFFAILAAITYFLYWYIIDWYTSSSCCVLRTLTGVSDSDATPESFPKHEYYDLFSQLYYSINPPSSRKQANSYNAKMTTPKIT